MEELKNINWKIKKNYLINKYENYLKHLNIFKNKNYKFIYITLDYNEVDFYYNNELNLISGILQKNYKINNNKKLHNNNLQKNETLQENNLFFTTNTFFTKIEVISFNTEDENCGIFKNDGQVEGTYFYNENLLQYLYFKLTFNIFYKIDGEKKWNYNLSFYKTGKKEELKIFDIVKKDKKYTINKSACEKLKEWFEFKKNSDVNDWLCETFLLKELSFLDLKDYRMGLLEKCLQIDEEEDNQEEEDDDE